ncbi:M20/M25/M40 family metallo-hydrolase [Thermodesulfatator atlanticus]|uniref:M20/M25/M40 family metallo-hydrolase n=1 Tax=Thermodesulfatator atlanticus TaxID=501497 RepID=UPI0003B2E9D4|nr:M20/M25/M40 family metallo-hydrolase [Thermodesulfatator atlanticus]
MINTERLKTFFLELASIESPSRKEGRLARYLKEKFESLGAKCLFDNSSTKTGSEVDNLFVKINPSRRPLLFFAAHMDTVEPCSSPKIIFENNVFRTDGRTILGADDKSAIAILLEIAHILKEKGLDIPVEFVFTTCEEIGLLGAKYLDYSLLNAPFGYALDSEDPEDLINKAPEAIRFKIKVLGKAAHAGINPEAGINAIKLAAQALVGINLGRIDPETTANIGLIKGGQATNIVPEEVVLEGEVRSHSHEKLEKQWKHILSNFQQVEENYPKMEQDRPRIQYEKRQDYPLMSVPKEHQAIKLAMEAAQKISHHLRLTITGGGSDANIFNAQGFPCVILGTGMRKVHSTEEYLPFDDFMKACRLSLEILLTAARQS